MAPSTLFSRLTACSTRFCTPFSGKTPQLVPGTLQGPGSHIAIAQTTSNRSSLHRLSVQTAKPLGTINPQQDSTIGVFTSLVAAGFLDDIQLVYIRLDSGVEVKYNCYNTRTCLATVPWIPDAPWTWCMFRWNMAVTLNGSSARNGCHAVTHISPAIELLYKVGENL
jgi:hypothetical protein